MKVEDYGRVYSHLTHARTHLSPENDSVDKVRSLEVIPPLAFVAATAAEDDDEEDEDVTVGPLEV